MSLVHDAALLARIAHDGQVDKGGEPYFLHPQRVKDQTERWGLPAYIQAAAVLHDVVEDTEVTIGDVVAKFGNEVADPLRALTHPHGEPYLDYIDRILAEHPFVQAIKMADMIDNTEPWRRTALDQATDERLQRKYRPAWARLRNSMVEAAEAKDLRVAVPAARIVVNSPLDLYMDGRR